MDRTKDLNRAYKDWILSKGIDGTTVKEKEDGILLESDYATACVNFYEMEMTVVELRITSRKNDETAFFLHFELRDLDYAIDLFKEMEETFKDIGRRHSLQVLLSCTSALTTGLMAEKLNEAARLSGMEYSFDAVPFPELYEKAPDYDILLLAPQLSYESGRIRKILDNMTVLDIPPRMFGTYDANAILELVRNEVSNKTNENHKKGSLKSVEVEHNELSVLTLAFLMQERGMANIVCRYYKGGCAQNEETYVRKPRNFITEVCDILDSAKFMGSHYDMIGITMPGEVWDGRIYLNMWKLTDINVKKELEEKYHVPVILNNNAQVGAYGFWMRHKHYKSAVFMSQSNGSRFGGAGIVANGRLLSGSHGIAGEIKYILRRIYGLTLNPFNIVGPEEMQETMDLYVRCVIGLIDPEIILFRNRMIPDEKTLRESLLRTVPERVIPKLRKISDEDALEYMLLGIMMISLESYGANDHLY